MRNLLTIERSVAGTTSTEVPDLPLSAIAWGGSEDSLICTHGPSESEAVVELKRVNKNGQSVPIASWDASPSPSPSLPCDRILALHYFPDTSSICVIFAAGDIVVIQEDPTPEVNKIEIVGSVDEGITAAEWSPDEEILAITTGASTFLLMTREFEPIVDVTLSPNDLNASKHVSVGWGKSETQFKGKRAKAMRDPTVPEKIDEGVLSPHDDNATRISWRGDGEYLALSSVEDSKRRVIRVYSRDGSLDSVSEPVDGLEGPLSWRPVGNLMAGIQRFPERLDVVFFERNGLRHGEFTLRIPTDKVNDERILELLWNYDSSALAICFKDRVQLWSMGNYHWYPKQELIYPKGYHVAQHNLCVKWHSEKPLRLALGLGESIISYEFSWSVFAGSPRPPDDHGILAVVDGTTLKLTPLRVANIPPPMALREVELKSTPVDVAVSPTGRLIAVLRDNALDLIRWDFAKNKLVSGPTLTSNIMELDPGQYFRHISFADDATLGVVHDMKKGSVLQVISIPNNGQAILKCTHEFQNGATVVRLGGVPDHKSLFYQDTERKVYLYDTENKSAKYITQLPAICPWLEIAFYQEMIFGLSGDGRLYVNSKPIASNCTSFTITPAHLIFTTTRHFVKFVHLYDNYQDLDIPGDDPSSDERCRSIERGARLVQVMPTKFALTLQMPRGNLETIYPRALVLAGVRRSIEAKDYLPAFLACRNHRVDLNILHDHASRQFIELVELFIDQVKKIEYIDLFLSQLREEDVSRTMYRETLQSTGAPEPSNQIDTPNRLKSKVNTICDAFLNVLLPKRLSSNLQNIITAYVCKTPPDHDAALLLIGDLREKNLELAEEAIQHVCFMSDVNKLYDNALGLYDLDLTLMVAQQSQKDPREYLPFLQKLQEMEITRRKFTIDDHLNRPAKACAHLHDLGDEVFDELKSYVVKHELYSTALGLYKYSPDKLQVIMGLYAIFLEGVSRYPDAGLAYESLGDYSQATQCYRRAGLWQEALFAAIQVPYSAEDLEELSSSLAEALCESKDYQSAATIHMDHRGDVEEAAKVLCKGCHFGEAMRLIGKHGAPELLETVVDAGLAEGFAQSSELIADCKRQLKAQLDRIRELRTKKEENPLAYFDGVAEEDAPDNVSLAPTNASTSASLFTRYTSGGAQTAMTGTTRRTFKNRRREERKRARGKKGSVYEEEYLVSSIGRMIEKLDSVRDETKSLLEGLVRRRMRERAIALQGLMEGVLGSLEGCVWEVFEEAGEVVNPETGAEGGGKRAVPIIKKFDGVGIL
ncbi:IkappaB kinase complex, IKAP component [Choiromyces venosus 120613-1]|uniref:Elongator complex protein 1 n=1 Tax=Choiromyces venosus 120613-1 TaxID=1336337 RepID=A0A3N4IXE9_9PEZI|nr:IkappaB kinase complex, IKAP component [Choiromyces venosus 120613-1]